MAPIFEPPPALIENGMDGVFYFGRHSPMKQSKNSKTGDAPTISVTSDVDDQPQRLMSRPQNCRRGKRVLFDENYCPSRSSLTSRLHSSGKGKKMRRIESCPSLVSQKPKPSAGRSSPSMVSDLVVIQGPASASSRTKSLDNSIYCDTNPEQFLKSILESNGYSATPIHSLSLENFFLEMTPDNVAGYEAEVISAVRQENIQELRSMLHSGKNLQCCNRFGESIVHMACRRGSERVLKFLLEEAQVSIRLRDDYGRTPLHDACWTQEPAFGVMAMLIKQCPDLLLMSDKRGHTPLSYARRDHWGSWCEFLKKHSDLLHLKAIV